jgi:hypothetical protein
MKTNRFMLLPDFSIIYCVLDRKNKNNTSTRIIVTSASDATLIIDVFKTYINNNLPCDFIISSIRDQGDPMRRYFETKINITNNDFCFEVPLAKITRRKKFQSAYQWYTRKIDCMVINIIGNTPFDI